jgi:radical SAM superfamily enzyme YgiQ (UPF0313 family)
LKILLVYPQIPSTFWSFRNALKFISKRSSEPPLGLLTVAGLLPAEWEKRLIDMNVSPLSDDDILWADYVFLTAMAIQRTSFNAVIKKCNELKVKVVAGGPMCTIDYREITGVDHFVLNEGEITLAQFIRDLSEGKPQKVYRSADFPPLDSTPVPQWQLLDMKKYATMTIQYSRGCPHDCEFCSITVLNGRVPRTKNKEQFLRELDTLYGLGWRGTVFIVDDNFIGNKKKLKQEILPAMIQWSREHHYPFNYITEAPIQLADDDELIRMMVTAGFDSAFIGIETTHNESLKECGKKHNQDRDLLAAVKKLQRNGLMVSGGFIVGFDSDPANIFEKQINFIQNSGIVTAMVGLLSAPPGTRLFKRLHAEDRIRQDFSGDNMDGTTNFVPKMGMSKLKEGYKDILVTIYAHKQYYERVLTFLKEYHLPSYRSWKLNRYQLQAFFKSLWILGVWEGGRRHFWKLIISTLIRYPHKFALAVTLAIYGFHFRRVVETI